jgi:hypothetical protein
VASGSETRRSSDDRRDTTLLSKFRKPATVALFCPITTTSIMHLFIPSPIFAYSASFDEPASEILKHSLSHLVIRFIAAHLMVS